MCGVDYAPFLLWMVHHTLLCNQEMQIQSGATVPPSKGHGIGFSGATASVKSHYELVKSIASLFRNFINYSGIIRIYLEFISKDSQSSEKPVWFS